MFYEDEKKEACQEVRKFLNNPNLKIKSEELSKFGVIGWYLSVGKEEVPEELTVKTLLKLKNQLDLTSDFEYGDFCVAVQRWIITEKNLITGLKIEGQYKSSMLKTLMDNTKALSEYKKVLKKLKEKGVVYGQSEFENGMESFWNFRDLDCEKLLNITESIRKILFNIKWYNFCLDMASDSLNIQALKMFRVSDETIINNIRSVEKDKTTVKNFIKKLSDDDFANERLDFFDLVMKPYPLKEYQIPKASIKKIEKLMSERKFSDKEFIKTLKF